MFSYRRRPGQATERDRQTDRETDKQRVQLQHWYKKMHSVKWAKGLKHSCNTMLTCVQMAKSAMP